MKNISLKTKMAVAVSLLFVVFSAIITWFSISYMEDAFKQSLASQQNSLACALADDIDEKLMMLQKALEGASRKLPAAVIADPVKAQLYLDERITLHSLFNTRIFILSKDGAIIAESPFYPHRRGVSLAFREFFQKTVATGKPVISSPFISMLPDHPPVVMMTAPVFDRQGKLVCVLCGGLRLMDKNLLSDLPQKKFGNTGYVSLSTSDRTMIVHPDKSRIMKQAALPGANKLYDKVVAGFDGTGETVTSWGMPVLASYKHLSSTNSSWILGLHFPLSEAYAPINKTRQILLAGIATGTLAMMALAWLVMRRLTRPLETVTRQVEAMAREPGAPRQLSYSATDEIGTLATAFNGMVAALDKKRAALLESENNFRSLAETASDGMMVISGSGSFDYCNYHAARILGYGVDELLRCGISDVAHPDDLSHLLERFHKVISWEKVPTQYVTRIVRKDGTVIPVEVTSSLTIWREQSADLVIFRDISERRRIEEDIRNLNGELQQQAAELAAANRELESFGYTLSHDLKAPLTTIFCAAQGLTDLYGEQLDETGKFFLDGICKGSERMDELIDAMFLFSRISRSELQHDEIDLSMLVTRIMLGLRMEDQNRKVDSVIAPGIIAMGDLPLLKSALENLLGNAWKYTRNEPVAHIEFGSFPHEGEQVYFVRDNGAGFDMKNADKLFKPFQRLHPASEFKGTGIGLATVHRIIERHGGKLWGEGEPGRGAAFYFTLPDIESQVPSSR